MERAELWKYCYGFSLSTDKKRVLERQYPIHKELVDACREKNQGENLSRSFRTLHENDPKAFERAGIVGRGFRIFI